jgi:hypothetical protein
MSFVLHKQGDEAESDLSLSKGGAGPARQTSGGTGEVGMSLGKGIFIESPYL